MPNFCVNATATGATECAVHRVQTAGNVLCGACEQGYTAVSGYCVPCEAAVAWRLTIVVALAWLYVLVLHALSQDSASETTGA